MSNIKNISPEDQEYARPHKSEREIRKENNADRRKMKVKYTGTEYLDTAFEKDKIYDVISVEKGWYRIMTELDEDYLFPPECFETYESEGDNS